MRGRAEDKERGNRERREGGDNLNTFLAWLPWLFLVKASRDLISGPELPRLKSQGKTDSDHNLWTQRSKFLCLPPRNSVQAQPFYLLRGPPSFAPFPLVWEYVFWGCLPTALCTVFPKKLRYYLFSQTLSLAQGPQTNQSMWGSCPSWTSCFPRSRKPEVVSSPHQLSITPRFVDIFSPCQASVSVGEDRV